MFYHSGPKDLPPRCRCGHVRGVANEVAPYTCFRFVCYSQDCQAFARLAPIRARLRRPAAALGAFEHPSAQLKLTMGKARVPPVHGSARPLLQSSFDLRRYDLKFSTVASFRTLFLSGNPNCPAERRCKKRATSAIAFNNKARMRSETGRFWPIIPQTRSVIPSRNRSANASLQNRRNRPSELLTGDSHDQEFPCTTPQRPCRDRGHQSGRGRGNCTRGLLRQSRRTPSGRDQYAGQSRKRQ
jgi:hypothetical protein